MLDVIVGTEQLSLAIGKRGQNVRLASKLLGCRIEIKSEEAVKDELASALASMLREMEGVDEEEEIPEVETAVADVDYDQLIPLEELEMLTERLRERLEGHGIHTVQDVLARTADELATIPGIGPVTAQRLLDMAQQTLDEALAEAAEAGNRGGVDQAWQQLRVVDLAHTMGITPTELIFKLRSIGVSVASEEDTLDLSTVRAIITGETLQKTTARGHRPDRARSRGCRPRRRPATGWCGAGAGR